MPQSWFIRQKKATKEWIEIIEFSGKGPNSKNVILKAEKVKSKVRCYGIPIDSVILLTWTQQILTKCLHLPGTVWEPCAKFVSKKDMMSDL